VVLDQGGASRKHARLTPAADGVWVEDSDSTNGTFVNGDRIEQPRLLKEGDELRAGQAIFTLAVKAPVAEEDPDATLLYDANPDPDATLLHSDQANSEAVPESPSESEQALATPPPAEDKAPAQEAAKEAPAEAQPESSESKAPPSWVLNNQQSVDGTAFFSRDSLQDSLRISEESNTVQQEVTEPTLIGNGDPVVGMRFQLIGDDKNQWEIGRSPNADVMLNHESVSGAHAQIICDAGRWKVVDLMSANGTYVNGKKCLTGYLSSSDSVCFGSVECAFMLPDGEEQARSKTSRPGMKTAAIAFLLTSAVAGLALFLIPRFL
jgi:pSer/pThr/pTyr-binding forkhead associated (FHA) protein